MYAKTSHKQVHRWQKTNLSWKMNEEVLDQFSLVPKCMIIADSLAWKLQFPTL